MRVPFRQPLRPPWRYSAARAQRKLLRMVASAVQGLCQVPFIYGEEFADLRPVEGDYLTCETHF